jgi:RimJ/RimL family protein N-acetyltransferase
VGVRVHALTSERLVEALRLADDNRRDSGQRGAPIYAPTSAHTPARAPSPALLADLEERLERPLREPGWYRGFLLLDDERAVGELTLGGGELPTETHRATLGMGLRASHRGRGLGAVLLQAAVDWAAGEPALAWLDLGVFAGNGRAHALYLRLGFVEVGRVVDRFRVDGEAITEIRMTRRLRVS